MPCRVQCVTVIEYPDRRIELLHDSEVLPFKVFDRAEPIVTAVDDKTLNLRVDHVLEQRRQTQPTQTANKLSLENFRGHFYFALTSKNQTH